MLPIKDPHRLHKDDYEKFWRIINSLDTNSDEITSRDQRLIAKMFIPRIGDWKKLISNVETADHRKAFKYAEEWLRFIGYKGAVLKTHRDFSVSLPKEIEINFNNDLLLPYSIVFSFYNKLAKVFDLADIWQISKPVVLDFIKSVYFYENETIFDYTDKAINKSPLSFRIRFYERIDNYRRGIDNDISHINLILYPLKEINLIDRYLISLSESMFYALGGYGLLDPFELHPGFDSEKLIEGFDLLRQAIDAGLSSIKFGPGIAGIVCIPKVRFDSKGRLHNENGPAVQFDPEHKEYYYNGIRVDERIIMRPEELTIKEIMRTKHPLKKEAMIAKYGLERFIEGSNYKVLDSLEVKNKRYELISLDIKAQQDLRAIKVVCPSTRKTYYLRVSPNLQGFDEALAWTFGYSFRDILFFEET